MKKIKQNIKKNPIFKDKTFKTLVKKMKKCINENCTNVKIFEKEKKIYSNNWKKTCKTKKIYSDFFEKIKDDKLKKDFTPSLLKLGNLDIYLARHFGFCYGVENAIEIAFRTIEENPVKMYEEKL